MIRPTPIEWLAFYASGTAAQASAFAPLFGNDPADMGALGFILGFFTGLPVYAFVMVRRLRAGRR